MDIIGRNKNFGLTLFFAISTLFLAYVMIFAVYQAYREREYKKELAGVRVTIINSDGVVLMDTEKDPHTMPNHLQRHEVQQALQEGYGFDISRTSETDGERYFYSATYFPQSGQIIRSAIPYPGEKANVPITNRGYIILSVIIFLLLTAALFFYTRRVGRYVDSTIEDYRQKVRVAEEEKMRIKHDLTQNTAHELKTPLASINGYLETLASHPDLSPEQRKLFLDKCMNQAQRMTDFVRGRLSATLPASSYAPGLIASPLHFWLPSFISNRLREAFSLWGRQKHGFLSDEAIVIGVETRTSSPLRILRQNETLQHVQIEGLFPCGEGAGYAGGIVSAGVDGERCAEMCALYMEKNG